MHTYSYKTLVKKPHVDIACAIVVSSVAMDLQCGKKVLLVPFLPLLKKHEALSHQ